MIDIQILLFLFQVGRIDIGDRAVAVPFEEGQIGILLHDLLHYTIDIILHGGIAEVEHQLIPIIIGLPVWQSDGPVGMLLKQFALGVHHLRFDPDTEFHPRLFGGFH